MFAKYVNINNMSEYNVFSISACLSLKFQILLWFQIYIQTWITSNKIFFSPIFSTGKGKPVFRHNNNEFDDKVLLGDKDLLDFTFVLLSQILNISNV